MIEQEAAPLRFVPLTVFLQLFTPPTQGALLLLLGSGHGNDRQRITIALHITIQPLDQGQRVGPVGLDPFALFIPVLGPDHQIVDAQLLELPVQLVAKRPRFVTAVDFIGLLALLAGPDQKLLGRKLLGRLRGGVVDLANHTVAIGVNVNAELDGLGFRQVLC